MAIEQLRFTHNLTESHVTEIQYAQFTIREWSVIASCVKYAMINRHRNFEGETFTQEQFQQMLCKFPSSAL